MGGFFKPLREWGWHCAPPAIPTELNYRIVHFVLLGKSDAWLLPAVA